MVLISVLQVHQGFTHSKYIGLNADFLAFAYLNDTKKIGSRLRGIKDDLYFSEETGMSDTKASDVNGGIVLNIDFPIHIITTSWSKVPLIKKIGFFDKYLNFELQLSPFIDIALVHNKVNNRSLHYKDGIARKKCADKVTAVANSFRQILFLFE